jgi:hypothetical protein
VNDQEVTTQALETSNPDETIYVHLSNGDVVEVQDVVEIVLTDTHLIITFAEGVKTFERRDIYFCGSEPDAEPSAY